MLVGSILAVRMSDVVKVAALYAVVGLFHWICRRPFFSDLLGSVAGVSGGLADSALGLPLLRLVRRGRGQLGPRGRGPAGVLVPDRAGPGRHRRGRTRLQPPGGRVCVRDGGQRAGHARLGPPRSATGATVACMFGLALVVWSGVIRGRRIGQAVDAPSPHAAEPALTDKGAS
jgi:hypothetical protein